MATREGSNKRDDRGGNDRTVRLDREGNDKPAAGLTGSSVIVKLLAAVIIFLVIGFVGLGVSRLLLSADIFRQVFRLVMLPLCAFLSGLLSMLILRHAGACLIASLFTDAVIFLIVAGLSWSVLAWNLLYILGSLIGILIAYVILTHKGN
ncbi:MAG: hypothetical protein J5584_04595 [Clostridia bacterium]|nr:hypothetical protein [Clostridia bacterium]